MTHQTPTASSRPPLRIWRSPYSDFGKSLKVPDELQDETITALDVYDDQALGEIAAAGFNAIWVHGLLHNIVHTDVFPELGRRSARHLRNMRKLISRADRFGIKVLIYMQPPRGLNVEHPFWKKHPDVGGHEVDFTSDDGLPMRVRSFCTSTSKVKHYLEEASARLAAELPGLGGVILVTASEYPSHCWGRCGNVMLDAAGHIHEQLTDCPQCATRTGSEIVVEIITRVRSGIRSQSNTLQIIAWNWSWIFYEKAPCIGIIAKLPKDVMLMVGFERGGYSRILGKRRVIDEYSLSYAGPSQEFKGALKAARQCGLDVTAKLQIGTTHELATVPSIPLIGNLYDKAHAMRASGVSGFMGCWNFGNMTTANTAAFNHFLLTDRLPGKQKALMNFADAYFPGCHTEYVVMAWTQFAEAMKSYPFSIPFLYSSPVNYSLAYPLKPEPLLGQPMGRSWQNDKRGDDLQLSLGGYSLAEVIRGLGEVARKWKQGVRLLESGLKSTTGEAGEHELDNARVCYHVFRSTWNTYRVYKLRLHWSDAKRPAFQRIVTDELANLEAVLPIVKRDKRFGYHSEAHAYMFDAVTIRRKIRQLSDMKTQTLMIPQVIKDIT